MIAGILGFLKALPEMVKLFREGVEAIKKLVYEAKLANKYKKIDSAIKKAQHEGKTEDLSDRTNGLF